MIQRKMKRSREYMEEIAVAAQRHDSIDFLMPTGHPAWRSYEARIMIDSTIVLSIPC